MTRADTLPLEIVMAINEEMVRAFDTETMVEILNDGTLQDIEDLEDTGFDPEDYEEDDE
jgi:hypothetical protein